MSGGSEQQYLTLGANLALAALGAEVSEALHAAGVRSILIKGPLLVRWLYGSETARASSDLDLLIDAATVGAAEAVLEQLGFARVVIGVGAVERPRHASTWVRASDARPVDLHTTVVGVGVSPPEAWAALEARTAHETLEGAAVEVPRPEARLVLIALHAAQHGEREPQPLRDLARALEVATWAQWREAAALAEQLRADAAFVAGLDLLEPGRALRDELGLSTARTVEASLRAKTAPPLTLGLEWFTHLPGLRPRLRFVFRKTFPPPAFMRLWSPLARRGRVGLVVAYLWRPVWLVLRGGPALAALRRARRDSRP